MRATPLYLRDRRVARYCIHLFTVFVSLVTVLIVILGVLAPDSVFAAHPAVHPQARQKKAAKSPQPLDAGVMWRRDPVTGEIRGVTADQPSSEKRNGSPVDPHSLQALTQMVPVTCIVSTVEGTSVPGLRREDFRIFEDGIEQSVAYFDASTQSASVAIVIDASPSVLRDSQEMKQAASALIDTLAPLDQAAVVDFSAHTYLQLPFSDVREMVRRAVDRINARALLEDTGGSNIYQSVYFAAKLFAGRTGRKAIVLLTDGQDSGLGLTLDPASAAPQPGRPEYRLTFDDVARTLAAEDIQIFAVSTENRPKVMTPDWLAAHTNSTLVTPAARSEAIPPYTLYLAEIVRRAGGQIYFLREAETMADTFRKIAEKIRAEYTLGFYPKGNSTQDAVSPGWHSLRVDMAEQPGIRAAHRAAYYVPAVRNASNLPQ